MFLFACQKVNNPNSEPTTISNFNERSNASRSLSTIIENFETGSKTSYATASVAFSSGSWTLNDALIGNTALDKRNGLQSARVRNSGILTTNFDYTTGASTVSIVHALYGSDAAASWQLWYSINGGASYIQSGSTINTTAVLQTANFTINISGNIRFQIRKTDGSTNRINFDDFSLTSYVAPVNSPVLSFINPAVATAGGSSFILTASGSNFLTSSIIYWNGVALSTTYVSTNSLTAIVPSSNISSAGSASITVTTAGAAASSGITFIINTPVSASKRYLFDATKAETAGNADWVIDQDNNTPQKVPTPLQSTITSTTTETYWTGALSSWGIALVKAGHFVETLPSSGTITYGNANNAQDLSKYDVFVVDEPNKVFTAAEKTAILTFVQNGGGLFMVADHTSSDRNNDGLDSPEVWNDLMTNNTINNNPFGFTFDLVNISQTATNVWSGASTNPILNGSVGSVSQVQFNNGTTMTLQPTANGTVQGLVWRNTYSQSTNKVMAASSTFGTGRVFVVGDSSPMDDGTGASGNTLYVSWSLYSHRQLFMNASLWLAKVQ